MSQLSQAPLRSAKHLKKIKEIRKVRAAILWHEKDRKARKKKREESHEVKQTSLQVQQYKYQVVNRAKYRALKNAREDWKLGPLRPNRAVGEGASTYGAVPARETRGPTIPEKVQQYRNEVRERRGKEPEYPIVVDDKKYFPIVEGDRVVIVRGREKGQIGTVSRVFEASHEIAVKDLNKAYFDSAAFASMDGQEQEPKREEEAPMPFDDVRLVVPYRITLHDSSGQTRDIYEDVVVDKLVMERHTTGVDPFTGIDHGADEFPEEHRYDPATSLPIFRRYIAGTKSIIQWPWEFDPDDFKAPEPRVGPDLKKQEHRGYMMRSLNWLKRLPSTSAKAISRARRDAERDAFRQKLEEWQQKKIETTIEEAQKTPFLRAREERHLADGNDDATLNLAEPSDENRSFYPSLVYPPFPNDLPEELPGARLIKSNENANSDAPPQAKLSSPHKDGERKPANMMKTPMQLRWEVERAKKLKEAKPLVETDALLLALGKHMERNGIPLPLQTHPVAGGETRVQ